jgi:7-cyano-7-deazaguanine synthase
MYKRNLYQSRIDPLINTPVIKVITGMRRAGKSCLLKLIMDDLAAHQADAVATAVHGGDHFIYPDCRPAFTQSFDAMQRAALDGYANVRLYTPFVERSKADIVTEGAKHGTPFAQTWSCYKGGAAHCGRCGTCVERREAFHLAGVDDPTEYADPHFWRQAVAKAS